MATPRELLSKRGPEDKHADQDDERQIDDRRSLHPPGLGFAHHWRLPL